MAWTEDSTKIEDLRNIVSQWPGYGVIGSRAYGKENHKSRAMLVRLGTRTSLPKVVERAGSNGGLKAIISAPGYHPEDRPKQAGAFFSPKELENDDMDQRDLLNDVIHTIDLLKEGAERCRNLIMYDAIIVDRGVLEALTNLRKRLWKNQ